MPLRFSVIVPTLNEEGTVASALESLRAAGLDDVTVVDGGSTDGTVARAEPLASRVLTAEGGLFSQLNEAAASAAGDVVVFHYADVRFPALGRAAMERGLAEPSSVGGAFRLAFDSDRLRFRLVARGTAVRNRLGVGPFGDQTIFVRADVFRHMGGFDAGAFLPDLQLVRRLRSSGRFVLLSEPVHASVRRWERNGFVRTLLDHWRLEAAYLLRGGTARQADLDRAGEATKVR